MSPVCRKHNPVLSSFITYHWVFNERKTMDDTSGAGTTYPFVVNHFISGVLWGSVARSLVFCVVFCRSLFVLVGFMLPNL